MSILAPLNSKQFLQDYWQKKHYVFRQVIRDISDLVNGDDLAGLACEEEVESRIIQGLEHFGPWTCQTGPFDENTFAQLPTANWTLLVQGLDQYSDDIRNILTCFDFLPRWRLEDIMASYAPIGGGVGPHFDYYDVFLIQVSGMRQWKVGQACNDQSPLLNNTQVKLLEDFVTEESYELHPGDMIYIPAGQAHWGTALSDDCITFSVGFRAPSQKELVTAAVEYLIEHTQEQQRYKDTVAAIDSQPGKINSHTLPILESLSQLDNTIWQSALQQAFGELVTVPRHGIDEDDTWKEGEGAELKRVLLSLLEQEGEINIDLPPASRIAFSEHQLYVNGESYNVEESFSQQLDQGCLQKCVMNPNTMQILLTLIERGDIFLLN